MKLKRTPPFMIVRKPGQKVWHSVVSTMQLSDWKGWKSWVKGKPDPKYPKMMTMHCLEQIPIDDQIELPTIEELEKIFGPDHKGLCKKCIKQLNRPCTC